jgi:Ca2+-binding EF-hand superfamily protein
MERVIPGNLSEVELSNYVEEYSSLGLSEKDIIQIYVEFRKIDVDDVGSVTLEELFSYLGIEQNTFTSIIFGSFDVDLYHLDDIDFPRFLQALWNYCTLAEENLCTL